MSWLKTQLQLYPMPACSRLGAAIDLGCKVLWVMVSMTTGNGARQPEVRVCARGRAQPSMARRLCARCWRGDSSLFSMQPPDCISLPFGSQTQHKNDVAPTASRGEHTLTALAPLLLLSCVGLYIRSLHTHESTGDTVCIKTLAVTTGL